MTDVERYEAAIALTIEVTGEMPEPIGLDILASLLDGMDDEAAVDARAFANYIRGHKLC